MILETYGIFTIVAVIAALVMWVYTLVRQATKKQWVWFVFTLIINVTWIVYWILVLMKKVK